VYLSLREDLDVPIASRFVPPVLPRRRSAGGCARLRWQWPGFGRSEWVSILTAKALESRGVLVFRSNGYAGKWQIAKNNPILGFSLYDENVR